MNLKKITKIILFVALFVMINTISANAAVYDATFNSEYYANKYADLKRAMGYNEEALRSHFYNYGIREGRIASSSFDVKYYLANNPDLKKAFGNNYEAAYNHFVNYGMYEGRTSSASFDAKHYIAKYPDLKKAFGEDYAAAYNHFVNYGIQEGRKATSADHVYGKAVNGVAKCIVKGCKATKDEHNWCSEKEATVTTPATCDKEGERTYYCKDNGCLATKTEKIAKTAHDFDETVTANVTTIDATCTKAGKKIVKCKNCSAFDTEVIDAKGHKLSEVDSDKEVITPATCTEVGKERVKCTNTGCEANGADKTKWVEREIPMIDHTPVTSTEKSYDAECEKAGLEVTVCQDCGKVLEQKVIPAKGHPMNADKTDYDPSKVTIKVLKQGSCNSSTQAETKGSRQVTCKDCGKTWTEETDGHQWETTMAGNSSIKPATCTTDGKKICINCSKTETITKLGHDFDYANDAAKPTCTADGTKTCQRAGCTETETVKKLGHTYKTTKAPIHTKTQLVDGTRTCTVCNGDLMTAEEKVITAAHNNVRTEPTCVADGKIVCKDCGREEKINKTGHNYIYSLIEEATASKIGSERRHCVNCDDEDVITIPVGQGKGHTK